MQRKPCQPAGERCFCHCHMQLAPSDLQLCYQSWHADLQKKLEEIYLQPIVRVKRIPREQQAAHEHAFDR